MPDSNQPFRLINYRVHGAQTEGAQVGLAFGERIIGLDTLAASHPLARTLSEMSHASELRPGIQGLLTDWERSLDVLFELAALVSREGMEGEGAPWQREYFTLNDVHVLAPVLHPTKMLFAGANYERHVKEVENWKESGMKPGEFKGIDKTTTKPYVFIKLPYCINGPFDAVVYPSGYQRLDWEGELALVIGKRGKHIRVEDALDYVAGFLIANDYSLREVNMRADWPGLASDWFMGKNFDTSAVLGPYFVPKQFVPDCLNLAMKLTVNGEVKQQSFPRDMVFKPDEIIAFASANTTLEPGDVIATGSPPGAGFATGKYLKVGDVVEAEIEGLGRQRNLIVAEQEDTSAR